VGDNRASSSICFNERSGARVTSVATNTAEEKDMISTKSAILASALLGLLPLASWAQSPRPAGIILAQQQDEQGKPGEKKKPDEQHPAVGNKPGQPPAPAAHGQPSQPKQPTAQTPPAGQQGQQGQKPGQTPQPSAQVQTPQTQQPNQKQEKPGMGQQGEQGQKPGQPQSPTGQSNPAFGQKPGQAQSPTGQPNPAFGQKPGQAQSPTGQPNPAFGQKPGQPQSPTAQSPQPASVPAGKTAVIPPPNQVRQSQDFIRGPGQPPSKGLEALKQERHEVHDGNRTVIQEQDRTIVQEGGHSYIRHNEADRFAVNARSVQNEQRGNQTISTAVRADGTRIQNVVDADGRLIRRSRFDASGHEIVIIDNSWVTPEASVNFIVDLPPPVINIPRERYIVDMDAAVAAADIFAALTAPPIERIARRYSLDEILYSGTLRDRMPRIDLDTVTFDTGSWQIGPDQFDKLAVVADAIQRALTRNPREVFLIEGHTDAVGSDVDNLSLSDRRAETVAVVLTEQFHVPPENLVTQGYGSQFLKIQTQAPERQNRRVAVRRITPLLEPDARS
jgi:outer membrane protein OmpA-like peptidoglycan-associated protein